MKIFAVMSVVKRRPRILGELRFLVAPSREEALGQVALWPPSEFHHAVAEVPQEMIDACATRPQRSESA